MGRGVSHMTWSCYKFGTWDLWDLWDLVRDIIAVTSASPQGSSWVTLGWLSVTCRRHVPVVYSSPRSLRPHLLKDSSLSIYLVPQSCLYCPLSAKFLSHLNPSYSFLKKQLALKTRLFVYIHHSSYKFYNNPIKTLRAPHGKPLY